jgi:23S rRNA (uridine2552-2'-O)-methyltransferase
MYVDSVMPKKSKRWLKEHLSDTFVKQARESGFRSRAVYKLQDLQERHHLFKSGMTIIDLGAAPGGWSQLLVKLVGPKGKVIAVDILPMANIVGVEIIRGDFSEEKTFNFLLQTLNGVKLDWVVSDMAPNMSGHESIDLPRSYYLAELALDFAVKTLQREGGLLIKLFQGEGFNAFLANLKKYFKSVIIRKPKASKSKSKEIYVLARNVKINLVK